MTAYFNFWGITAPVFNGPAAGYLMLPRLLPAVEQLTQICTQGASSALVLGATGTGKSALARWLSESLAPDSLDVLLFAMMREEHSAGWLLPRLATLLGAVTDTNLAPDTLLAAIAGRLDRFRQSQRRLVIMIDAAHYAMTPAALTEIIALLNAESLLPNPHCLAFILFGQPELGDVIDRTPALQERQSVRFMLERFTAHEIAAYINWRLSAAGLSESVLTPAALDSLCQACQGSVGQVNFLAEQILIKLAARNARVADQQLVNEVLGLAHALPPVSPVSSSSLESQAKRVNLAKSSQSDAAPQGPASIRLASLFKSTTK